MVYRFVVMGNKKMISNIYFTTPPWENYEKSGDYITLCGEKELTLFHLPSDHEIIMPHGMILTGDFILSAHSCIGIVCSEKGLFYCTTVSGELYPGSFKLTKWRPRLKISETIFEFY